MHRSDRSSSTTVARAIAVALAYCLAARLGLEFPYVRHSACLVWPASGVALAAVLLWGRWMAAGVFLGAAAAARWGGIAYPLAFWFAAGNVIAPLFGAWLLRQVGDVHLELDRQRDVLGFVLLGVIVGTLPGPTAGVAGLVLLDSLPRVQVGGAWLAWWLGDAAGVLLVTPALVVWSGVGPRQRASWWRRLEALALAFALAASTLFGFGDRFAWRYPAAFMPFPFLIWAALRFGVKGATAGSVVVSGIAVWSTAHGIGPFSFGHLHVDLALLWMFVAAVAVVTLLLSAALGERDLARRSLERSEERFRRAFDNAPIAMAMATPEGRLLQGNNCMHSLLGYSSDELPGLTIDEITYPDDRERSRVAMRRAREGAAEHYGFEKRFVRSDGDVVWVNMSTTLLRNDDGSPHSFIGLLEDITARKYAEEERERLQQQLARSQRLESIGQLAGGVAHDFNNLLLGILLYVDLGFEYAKDRPKLEEALREIRAAARRAAELTRQLLAFGRRQAIQPQALDLDARIESLMGILRRTIPANIEVEHPAPAEPCWVLADPGQIERVIVNLCMNARDAMPGGGVLRIETGTTDVEAGHATLAPGHYAALRISDTGVGIDAEVRERIFEPFFTTKEQGTGLGLAVIYGVVRQHGGSVEVSGEPGKGTTFEILLPAAQQPLSEYEEDLSTHVDGGDETILVVDDEELPRRMLSRVLCGAGYTVLSASDGVEGLELFREHQDSIGLVVLDVIMPRMGGHEAYERIRDLDPCMKVMVTTGYAGEATADIPEDAELLRKPYEAGTMLRSVRRLLDNP